MGTIKRDKIKKYNNKSFLSKKGGVKIGDFFRKNLRIKPKSSRPVVNQTEQIKTTLLKNENNSKETEQPSLKYFFYLWKGLNRIVNYYINYRILLNDEWETDKCSFKIYDNKSKKKNKKKSKKKSKQKIIKEINLFGKFDKFGKNDNTNIDIKMKINKEFKLKKKSNPNLSPVHILMEKCQYEDETTVNNNKYDDCIVTVDSFGNKFRCHTKKNFQLFKEGVKIKIQGINDDTFKLIKIVYPSMVDSIDETVIQAGGNSAYLRAIYLLDVLDKKEKVDFLMKKSQLDQSNKFNLDSMINKIVKSKIYKFVSSGSFFFYMNQKSSQLIINFPMFVEPYLDYFRPYHIDTLLSVLDLDLDLEIKDKDIKDIKDIKVIKVHKGYNDLIKKNIDNLDRYINNFALDEIQDILFTGHSLGASIIQLALFYLLAIKKNENLVKNIKKIKLFTSGATRVGNIKWFEWWEKQEFQIFNFCNTNDPYCFTPGIKREKKKEYDSRDIDDFYPVKPILYDYDITNNTYYIVKEEEKKERFFYKHLDYQNYNINFSNSNSEKYYTDIKKRIHEHHNLSQYDKHLPQLIKEIH